MGEGTGGGGAGGGGVELLWCGQTLWEEMADADFTQVKQGMDQWDPGLAGNSDPVTQAHVGQPDGPAAKRTLNPEVLVLR